MEQELVCKFVRIDPDKEDLDIFNANNEIFRHIKQSSKKILINKSKLKPIDKFMHELHLRQPRSINSTCGPFTKHRWRIKKFRETGNLKHLYRNELDKACFAHDAAYPDSKDLAKRTISNKVLKDRAYKIAINPTYDGYQGGLESMVYKFFDKKTRSGASVNEDLADKLHKPMIKKSKESLCEV